MRLFVVELLDHVAVDTLAEGVIILLERVAIVQVAIGLERHRRVIALELPHQLRVIIDVVGVLNHLLDVLEIHLAGFDLRLCQAAQAQHQCHHGNQYQSFVHNGHIF